MTSSEEMEAILVNLHSGLASKLPAYARPIFVRFAKTLDLTGFTLIRQSPVFKTKSLT
jgi:hypothetical protein